MRLNQSLARKKYLIDHKLQHTGSGYYGNDEYIAKWIVADLFSSIWHIFTSVNCNLVGFDHTKTAAILESFTNEIEAHNHSSKFYS